MASHRKRAGNVRARPRGKLARQARDDRDDPEDHQHPTGDDVQRLEEAWPEVCRTSETPVTSASHQASEPAATPAVATSAWPDCGSTASPALANTAANAMIVMGLVRVSATADA